MEAYQKPIDDLREILRWFIAVQELQLLHVAVSSELRQPALREIAQAQAQEQNRAALFFFTTPALNDDSDWSDRIVELAESFEMFAEEAAKGAPPHTLRAPAWTQNPGVPGFKTALKQAVNAVQPACDDGVVAILAPEGIEDSLRWVTELRHLVGDRSLSKVRFIVVELAPAPSRALATEMGGFAESVDLELDAGASKVFLAKILRGMKTAPPGADPQRVAGMAGPREAPPPRRNRAAPPPDQAAAELQGVGVNPGFASPDAMQALRIEALSASLAHQEGRPQDAIQHQLRAKEVAENAGLTREATLMQLMLGSYLLQSAGPAQALGVFDQVAKRAKAEGYADLEVQSHMSRGGALLMSQRPFEAAQAYREGAVVAEQQPSKALAIECNRMIGQILLGTGNEKEAAAAWQRALALAEGADPLERGTSSAPVAARDLAALYRRHGLHQQADALDAQIQRWETEAESKVVAGTAPEASPGAATNGAGAPPTAEPSA
jgi:tetratricopeptide (TPR) repeat protein